MPTNLMACDPFSNPIEIFSTSINPLINPGVIASAFKLSLISLNKLPIKWESIEFEKQQRSLSKINHTVFTSICNLLGNLTGKALKTLHGRAILAAHPTQINVSRNALLDGVLQTLSIQISIPTSSKVIIYEHNKFKVSFIDEIDATTHYTITIAWPIVHLYHFRVWSSSGKIYEWPTEEQEVFQQGALLK